MGASRTRVGGSQTIRHCRSSHPIGHALRVFDVLVSTQTTTGPVEKSVFCGSGESMVASLKHEAIDGRAPPGVEPAA